MTEIIREQSKVEGADMATLLASFNALTGQSVKRFSSRAAAEQRLKMAIMAATDAAGHLGVPKGTAPKPLTASERKAKGEKRNPLADSEPGEEPEGGADTPASLQATREDPGAGDPTAATDDNPYKPGTMAHQLHVASARMAPIAAKAKREKGEPPAPRPVIAYVYLTGSGTGKLQATSARAAVIAYIKHISSTGKRKTEYATMLELIEHFEPSVKGHVQKLLALGHVRCEDDNHKEIK